VTGVLCENLRHLAATFRAAGIRRIALARAISDASEVEAIRVALGVDRLTVVRLTAEPAGIGDVVLRTDEADAAAVDARRLSTPGGSETGTSHVAHE
jgi:hypothetical protein